jgi:hypothetical protein
MTPLKKIIKSVIFTLCLWSVAAAGAYAATLHWDPSDGTVDGYKVYYSASKSSPSNSKDVGKVISYNLDKLPLSENVQYYFSVSAYNAAGESAPCPPVAYKPGDSTPPMVPTGLTALKVSSQPSLLIDNQDSGFKTQGNWTSSTARPGYSGGNYLYADAGDGSYKTIWSFTIDAKAKYAIYAQWTDYHNRAKDAPYRIYNNGNKLDSVQMNQQVNGGQLKLLGNYTLVPGTMDIVLSNNASGIVVADAIKVVKTSD